MEEQILYTKYVLLSFSEYFKLNMQISEAESFTIGAATERYTTMSPKTAKVNQQEDGSYDVALIFIVSTYIQETYPQFLEGLTLVDTYEPIVDGVTELIVLSLEPEVIDWTLMQYIRVGATEENMILKVSPDLISSIPEEALGLLESLGIQLNIL